MPLQPNYKLYYAAYSCFAGGITGPRPAIGQMCHDMVVDLLERAGLVTLAEAQNVRNYGGNSMTMARTFLAREFMDMPLDGAALTQAVNMQSVILCLYTPAQKPAHSLVTMGNGKVAGFNNLGSAGAAGGLNFNIFGWNHVRLVQNHYSVWAASPGFVAARIRDA
jgi:hypothetical protein